MSCPTFATQLTRGLLDVKRNWSFQLSIRICYTLELPIASEGWRDDAICHSNAMPWLVCRSGKRGVISGHQGSFDVRQRRKPSPMSFQMNSARFGSSMEST